MKASVFKPAALLASAVACLALAGCLVPETFTASASFKPDGSYRYQFDGTVVNENQYSTDWNGNWRHAVSERADGWSAEFLLPWHLAPMPPPVDGKRQLGIAISRVVGSTGERVAWPPVHLSEPRFLSALAPLEVAAFSQKLLAFTPYLVGLRDIAQGHSDSSWLLALNLPARLV